MRKFLASETREKVAVVSPRPAPARVEHFQYPQGPYGGTLFDADALPACLGGAIAETYEQRATEFYMHFGRGAERGSERDSRGI